MGTFRSLPLGAGILGVVACVHAERPPVVQAPAPEVVVVPSAPAPPEDTSAKAPADAAVKETAARLERIEAACSERWLETGCEVASFEGLATTYQAFYATHPDPRAFEGRMDALPRLGGPTSNVSQVAEGIGRLCEDRCRNARVASITDAVNAAADRCIGAKSGIAACTAVTKKMKGAVRASEIERWTDLCEGRCELHLREAEIERRRPRTAAGVAACRTACERVHGGGWCGTSLLECLRRC